MIKKELAVVTKALKRDKGLYFCWQSNIAMAFVDACQDAGIKQHKKIHTAANKAAKAFLDRLIGGTTKDVIYVDD